MRRPRGTLLRGVRLLPHRHPFFPCLKPRPSRHCRVRESSTSTAYSVSSVGSSVVHSMSRLRHMASPSGRYEARLGSHYERHRGFVEETHYERAFHEAYGAPAASGALEFDLETRYAVAGSRPRSGSGGSDGKRSGGGSRSGGSRSGAARSRGH